MPSDSWWASQEALHRRLQAAEEIDDKDQREEARQLAWGAYNAEREQAND